MTPHEPFSARGTVLTGLLVLAGLIAGFGLWGMATRIDGAILAPGQVEVDRNRQVVQHPDGGVVARIAVIEGQRVAAGDVLVVLDATQLGSDRALTEGQLFDAMARHARLAAERDEAPAPEFPAELTGAALTRPDVADLLAGNRSLFSASRDTFARQIEGLTQRRLQIARQIEGLDIRARALATQADLIAGETTVQRGLLTKGLTQSARILGLRSDAARLEGERGALLADRAEAEGRATDIGIEMLRLAAARRETAETELRDVVAREADLAERRRALDARIAALSIRAPVAGIVMSLGVTAPHAVLRPAEPLLYIVPQDRPLVVTAEIPVASIDAVHEGQSVRLALTGLRARDTVRIEGRVAVLSADAMTDPRTQGRYYRAEIALDQSRLPPGMNLLPGMPVEAFILTGSRSPLAYLLSPLTAYFSRAFRET